MSVERSTYKLQSSCSSDEEVFDSVCTLKRVGGMLWKSFIENVMLMYVSIGFPRMLVLS